MKEIAVVRCASQIAGLGMMEATRNRRPSIRTDDLDELTIEAGVVQKVGPIREEGITKRQKALSGLMK